MPPSANSGIMRTAPLQAGGRLIENANRADQTDKQQNMARSWSESTELQATHTANQILK